MLIVTNQSRIQPTYVSKLTVQRSVIIFSLCLVGLTLLAIAVNLVNSVLLHRGYPYNTFLFDPWFRHSDLTQYYVRFKPPLQRGGVIGPGPAFNYPALALFVYVFFIRFFPKPTVGLAGFTAGAALLALLGLRGMLKDSTERGWWIDASLLAVAFCSYPFMILIDRANIEGVGWCFALLGLVFFVKERYLASALFFGAAVCVKPFPGLFFFLLLNRRRYKEIAAAIIEIVAVNLILLRAIGPTIASAYRMLNEGVGAFRDNYVATVRFREMGFDHSLFSCLKWIMRLLGLQTDYKFQNSLLTAYHAWLVLSLLIIFVAGYYFRSKPVLNQLFAIVLLILLLPPVSYDYTLIHLYLPWGVFMIFLVRDIGQGRIRLSLRQCLWILIPCAILMAPQSYLIIDEAGFGGQVKALTLVVLFFVVARTDLPCTLFHELPACGTTGTAAVPAS